MMKNDRYTCAHRLLRRIRGFVLILIFGSTTLHPRLSRSRSLTEYKGRVPFACALSQRAGMGAEAKFCRFVVVIIVSYLPGEIDRHFTQEMSYRHHRRHQRHSTNHNLGSSQGSSSQSGRLEQWSWPRRRCPPRLGSCKVAETDPRTSSIGPRPLVRPRVWGQS
jgi:hypothetical protein